jgi:hypothetical protein
MERLICLLPDHPEQNWELMTDQFKSSLWDIYPETQICGVGENDTVIVDGARAAQIRWDGFTQVRTLRKLTLRRWFFLKMVLWSPTLLWIGSLILAFSPPPYSYSTGSFRISYTSPLYSVGVTFIVITLLLFILPAPYYIWKLYGGKLWQVEPCLFGIEGYVPIEEIEAKIFGMRMNRMSWSASGSPLSRHQQGSEMYERTIHFQNDDTAQLLPPVVSGTHTYPVKTIDPCSPCAACRGVSTAYCQYHPTPAFCHERSRSDMGQMKVFTLVDTFNMTATLFYAVRPPTALIIGGSEGGMKRAIACSFDMSTSTFYRETVLRIPTPSAHQMEPIPRVRLGLRRPFLNSDIQPTKRGT